MYREFFSIVFSLLSICINTEHLKKNNCWAGSDLFLGSKVHIRNLLCVV